MTSITLIKGGTTMNLDRGNSVVILRPQATVSVVQNYVAADTKFIFDGASGDTYLRYVSATGRLELVVDNVKQMEWGA